MIQGMNNTIYAKKLADLRAVLEKEGVDGFIVPRADEYQGEYVPAAADRLRWLTGFTGSAGLAIILKDKAIVMSDGRYTIQLRQEIAPELFETADSTKMVPGEWIAANAAGKVIGYDPRLHTPREIKALADKGIAVKPLAHNAVDVIWDDRPAAPSAPVSAFPISSAGLSVQDKLDQVAGILKEKKLDGALIALPDSIAWLLNIRSSDIPHIPVALSYALAHGNGTLDWFIAKDRVGDEVLKTFGNRVSIHAPSDLPAAIANLRGRKILADERRTAVWFTDFMQRSGIDLVDLKDPVIALKARKNEAEKQSMRRAHIRDGVAMVRFLKWLSEEAGKEKLTEMDVEAKLQSFRAMAPEYRDSSFDTIAGYGPNGAIVHYRATGKTNLTLKKGSLLLLDSGAQYADGTTDITRTIALGKPDSEMRRNFTLVLKAHIAVATARFPQGTTGAQIDALARAPLWQHNLDYAHGTGHGVGCYLSVHEEAASISPRGHDALEEGMILSNEPGYYKEGAYGIRIENLLLVKADGVCQATGKPMLAFETLTFAPMDLSLVDKKLLSPMESHWLTTYHRQVFDMLSPFLDTKERAWLKKSL